MKKIDVMKIYKALYPESFCEGLCRVPTGHTLTEIRIRPWYSNVTPHDVDLTSKIGPVTLNLPIISAAMDTVSGPHMARALSDVGGCCIIYRHKKPEVQLEGIAEALTHQPCLVTNPKSLFPDDPVEDAEDILKNHGFSTIPVVTKSGVLKGIVFTRDIAFKGHLNEPVKKWMMPIEKLKLENQDTTFIKIRNRLLNEQDCSVLPIINRRNKLIGMYFMKDFLQVDPATHKGKPLVGMAVSIHKSDLKRVREALDLGIGMIVIDSSHGNCDAVIEQAKRTVKMTNGQAAVIAGNIASIDGYVRLAEVGVDGVKCGIGSGSICTTSNVTGAGVPMFTLIRELAYARKILLSKKMHAPVIIPDGGIEGPGECVIALAAGGHACMAGKWLVAADESISYQENGAPNGLVYYRGMASKGAIKARSSVRYGRQKRAAEGVEGFVEHRGPLKKFIGKDAELVRGGFAHVNARNIKELHRYGEGPIAFMCFTGAGQTQLNTRVL
jgi:IMP dehydrogenase